MVIATIVLLSICTPFLWWYFTLWKHKSVNNIHGPKPLPIIGNAIAIGNTPQEFLNNGLKFSKQYNDIFKLYIANDLRVFIAIPDIIEQILSSNVHITKSDAYTLLKPWLGVGLLTSTGKKWRSRRKMITPTFHFKILDQFIDVFNSCGNVLVRKLSNEVGKDCIDIYPFINLYSLDIICESAMGVKVLAQEGENTKYVDAVRNYLDIFMIRTFSVWKRFELLFKLSDMYTCYKESIRILHDFSNNVIIKRREQKSKQEIGVSSADDGIKRKVALLDMLLESENNYALSNEDIREEIDTFTFEGHDTTTSGIGFAILALAENQDVQEKVFEEIVSVIGNQENTDVTMQHLQETRYIEMVIKEVQRIYPSVPIFERLLETDCTIGGYNFPKGIFFSLFVYAMHHNEKYFPDPEKFDPYRFLPENQSRRHNFVYAPFSAGPRNCIGQKFAMFEMKATIIKIVRNFRILPVPNFKPDLGMAAVLKSYNGICVRLEKRHAT